MTLVSPKPFVLGWSLQNTNESSGHWSHHKHHSSIPMTP